jgi:tetratricopeptide (TPR) repeat protein
MWLGLAQTAKGDWTGAIETYGRLTQSFPDEPALWAQYANALAAAGKNDEAKKSAKTALDKWTEARAPKSKKDVKLGKGAQELAMIARAMRRAGDPAGALAALARYEVPKDETAPILDVERGFAKRAKKDVAGAKVDADKAIRAGGESFAAAHVLLAALAVDSKKPDEAKAHLAAWNKYAGGDPSYALEAKQILDAANAPPAAPDTKPPAGKAKKSG